MVFKLRDIVYLVIATTVTALDLFTKYLIQKKFELYQIVQVIGDTLRIFYIRNTGFTFGLLSRKDGQPSELDKFMPYILVGLSLAALTAVFFLYINISRMLKGKIPQILGRISMMFVVGGALGNIIDRLLHGAVTDFIDFGIGEWRWYTFNVADSFVVVGGIALVILFAFFEYKAEKNEGKSTD